MIFKDGIFILIIALLLCILGACYSINKIIKDRNNRLEVNDKFVYPSKEIAYKEACKLQKHKYTVSVKEVDLNCMRNIEKILGYKPIWENYATPDKIVYGAHYKKYRKESLKYLKNKGYNLLIADDTYTKEYYPDFEYDYEFNKALPVIDSYWLVTICDDETRYL